MSSSADRDRTRGQALTEFAMVIPIFLALLFGMLDLGRVVWANNTLAEGAREAARFAIVNGKAADKAAIRDVALRSAVAGGTNVTVTVCYGTGCSGDTDWGGATGTRGTPVTVVASSEVPLVAGALLGMGTFRVSGSSTMLVNN